MWRKILILGVFLVVSAVSPVFGGGLEALVPVSLEGIQPDGDARVVKGQELFGPINGGAVTFMKHGFQEGLFQDFIMDGGKVINLEIYHMGSVWNARTIFLVKKEDGEKIPVDAEGVMAGYFCMFWKGPYFVTITGEDADKGVREALTTIAESLVREISASGDIGGKAD